MVSVTILQDPKGDCIGFKMEGHAEYAEYGSDIICSAVSVLVINAVNSIEAFTKDEISVNMEETSGLFELSFLKEASESAKLLLNSMTLGLQGIQEQYQNNYVIVTFKEV